MPKQKAGVETYQEDELTVIKIPQMSHVTPLFEIEMIKPKQPWPVWKTIKRELCKRGLLS
jgi:hypothetical protein